MKLAGIVYFANFIAVIVAGVAITNSFWLVVLLLAMEINRYLIPLMLKGNRRVMGVLAWFGCLLGLAGIYYLMDLSLFPHSARALFRARDAAISSLLGMTIWFAFYWQVWLLPQRRIRTLLK